SVRSRCPSARVIDSLLLAYLDLFFHLVCALIDGDVQQAVFVRGLDAFFVNIIRQLERTVERTVTCFYPVEGFAFLFFFHIALTTDGHMSVIKAYIDILFFYVRLLGVSMYLVAH